jgi:8-oxo-dGTP diphosphatase
MFRTEKEYLKHYNVHDYDVPLVSVDVAIFTLLDGKLHILLVERGEFPHKGRWSLPGGFINQRQDKDLQATALRTLTDKTGVKAPYLEQVATTGNANRDPRGWSVTSLYMALIAYAPTAQFIDSVLDARWWQVDVALKQPLAFDHKDLIIQARERLRAKAGYTALPMYILTAPFTLTQLQQTYEELMGTQLEKKSFRRKFPVNVLLDEVGEGLPEGGRGRTAALYRPRKGGASYTFLRSFGSSEE